MLFSLLLKKSYAMYDLFILPFLFAGQSPIDFLFDFVEISQGPFKGFDALDTRPRAGKGSCSDVNLMIC